MLTVTWALPARFNSSNMQIALIGYGRMGHEIEAVATERGHSVVLTIDVDNLHDFTPENLRKADVAIEFTRPHTASANVTRCLEAGVPVVCGTTGWSDQLPAVEALCHELGGGMLWASNFSLGMNLFFKLNDYLAHLMNRFPEYDVKITETHHIHKLDAPSGTAITLAEGVLKAIDRKSVWESQSQSSADVLRIDSVREGSVPGIHTVRYESYCDAIEITHDAANRKGLAVGAVLAAEYLAGKTGVFTMNDVLFH